MNWKKALVYLVASLATALGILFGFSSCNAVRTITTTSQYVQSGDTTTQIQVKTVESYTATKLK